jgi:hypothetical protein
METIRDLERQFQAFQSVIIERTKAYITPEEQINGKLILPMEDVAKRLSTLSGEYFALLHNILCQEANLSSHVPIVQNSSMQHKRQQVASENSF